MNISHIVSIYTGLFGSFNPTVQQSFAVSKAFLYCGIISTTATIMIIVLYVAKKNMRMHPNGILLNIMFIQFIVAIKYLLIGINNKNAEQSEILGYSFNYIKDHCFLESLLSYFLFVLQLIWNLIWLFDLYLSMKAPMYTTDAYLTWYSFVAYFVSCLLSFLIYAAEIRFDIFAPDWTYSCFVHPKLHPFLITIPEITYALIGYTVCYKIGNPQLLRKFSGTQKKLSNFFELQVISEYRKFTCMYARFAGLLT